MRISLIGPSNINFYYSSLLKIPKTKLNKQIKDIARIISNHDLVLTPFEGISLEIAKVHRKISKNNIYAAIPKNDKDFGIKHLEINKKVFNKIINTNTWYKHDLILPLLGDAVLMLGKSTGSLGELCLSSYLLNLFSKMKINKSKISSEFRAKIPFKILIYKPFIKEKLSIEIETYIKKVAKLIYVNSPAELNKVLKAQ